MRRIVPAALLLAACHARLDDPRPGPPDASMPANGPVAIDLRGDWAFTWDSVPSSYPMATVTAQSAASVTVAYTSASARDCGCSAQHMVVALPREIGCDATLSFDWTHGGPLNDQDSTALRIDFDPGSNSDSGDAGQFVGSTWHGSSGCAWRQDLMGHFPAPAAMADGHNEVALADLAGRRVGECRGTFRVIDIHVEGYDCTGTPLDATLANLVLR